MTAPVQGLLMVATETFRYITESEQTLLRAVAAGDVADYSGPTDKDNDPKHSDDWGELRTIRAKVIRWLCSDRDAVGRINAWGIRIVGAKIEGFLDLMFVTVPFPLVLSQCAIVDGVDLSWSDIRVLDFGGSYCKNLRGEGLVVRGDLFLRAGFEIENAVQLDRST